jgi:hypothetical protein
MKNRVINYLQRLSKWVLRGKYHLVTIIVWLITVCYLTGVVTLWPTFIASIFSICGLTILLVQLLLDARSFSDYKPNTIKNWIREFPLSKPAVANHEHNIKLPLSAKVHYQIFNSDNASLGEKVKHLLNQIGIIKSKIEAINNDIEKTNDKLSIVSEELTRKVNKVSDVLKTLIAGHAVGSYDINLLGIVLTIDGTLIQIFKVQAF